LSVLSQCKGKHRKTVGSSVNSVLERMW